MRLIDLDNDVLIEPNKKIIQNSSDTILTHPNLHIEDEVSRREFLLYASGIIAGTIVPTNSYASDSFSLTLIADKLRLWAIDIINELISETIIRASNELKKKNVNTMYDLSPASKQYVIDATVNEISSYLEQKINPTFVGNALLKHDILSTSIDVEAGWDIDRKNKLKVSFYNPTNKKITTKLEMYVRDVNTGRFDRDTPSIRYVRNFYLEVMPKSNLSNYSLFEELPQFGMKNIIFVGNKSFKNLEIKKSKNIIVDTILV